MTELPRYVALLDRHRADAARRVVALLCEGFDLRALSVLVVERESPHYAELGGPLVVASAAEIADKLRSIDPKRAEWLLGTGTGLPDSVRVAVVTAEGVDVGVHAVLEGMAEA